MPLGCGAIAGHAFGIDREFLREKMAFDGITLNSMVGCFSLFFSCVFELLVWCFWCFGVCVFLCIVSHGTVFRVFVCVGAFAFFCVHVSVRFGVFLRCVRVSPRLARGVCRCALLYSGV